MSISVRCSDPRWELLNGSEADRAMGRPTVLLTGVLPSTRSIRFSGLMSRWVTLSVWGHTFSSKHAFRCRYK